MDARPANVWKLQHRISRDIYFMRFGPPSTRFVRDGDPPASVFTNHGKPKQVSLVCGATIPAGQVPDPIAWDPDRSRPDWAYSQRSHFDEIE